MTIPSYEQIVQKIHFDEIVKQVQDLPTLPAVVMELLNSIDQDDVDITVLAKKVSHDQALTAKTLRFANSSFYGTQSKVTTIQQAITLLGVQSLRNLITAAAVTGCFPENSCAGFDHKAFWRHCMGTAVCAKVLARHLHVNQDYAYTAGLLHDIGRLVLVTRFTRAYECVLAYRANHDCYLLDAERAVLGVDHVIAGHALAQYWNFSETMQNAIAAHHDPDEMGGGSLASIIHVADAIVHALDFAGIDDDLVPPVSEIAWAGLGLDEATYLRVFREAQLEFDEISGLL